MAAPPELGFDCGRAEQNAFLYERAWSDQEAQLSVTYLYYAHGILAAYATVCMDAVPLGPRERDRSVPYQETAACKLAQLAVSLPFQGIGLGKYVVGDIISRAQDEAKRIGCRFLTLDAQPDLVSWYADQGFVQNKLRQDRRIQEAIARGRDPSTIAVSMRFDLGALA